jgi:hypothetical protein
LKRNGTCHAAYRNKLNGKKNSVKHNTTKNTETSHTHRSQWSIQQKRKKKKKPQHLLYCCVTWFVSLLHVYEPFTT